MPLDLSTLTDELSAVNVLLSVIDEAPVSDLDTAGSVDVAAAVNALNEVNFAVQSKGWHWNREECVDLAPNDSGEILLPDNCLEVAAPFYLGQRGTKLYDRQEHSYTFTEAQSVDLIVALEWDELPFAAKRYITIRAAKQFQARRQGSTFVDRVTDWEVSAANLALEQMEDRSAPSNQITGNHEAILKLTGRVRRRNG